MDVRIETYPTRLAACARHVGPYEQVDGTFKRLFAWASAADVLDEDTLVLGLSYDSPETVPASALRYDVCITLAEPVADLPEWIRPEEVGRGRYAVHTLKGPYGGIGPAFRRLFGEWLPRSGKTGPRCPKPSS